MKNAVKMLLCVLMCMLILSSAWAQGVECAGKLAEMESLKHYPSYTCDEETGKWSVHAYQADALMDRFWEYGRRNSSRTVVFHLAAEGDARTGVWTPVLRFYHIDGEHTGARAVSVLVNGARYGVTLNPAKLLKLENKGRITENADADLVLADEETLELESVMAKGVFMIYEKEVLVKGTFE